MLSMQRILYKSKKPFEFELRISAQDEISGIFILRHL